VFGVGGAGGNAIEHMIREGVNGVEFIAANTDAQALKRNARIEQAVARQDRPRRRRQAGSRPGSRRERTATRSRASLEGAHMAFITAGMGGGTGTGAAPVVAEIAREMGILTVGVVTKPFSFEGGKRMKAPKPASPNSAKHVDSLIVILNDKLMEVHGRRRRCRRLLQGGRRRAEATPSAALPKSSPIPGLVNVDFEDVRTVMGEMGRAMMGSAAAAGVDRARIAAEQAVASPLLEGVNLSGAKGVLVNITAAKGNLKMKEVNEVMNTVKAFAAEDAHIIFGAVYDELMGDALRVTVVATGLGQAPRASAEVVNTPVVQATGYRHATPSPSPARHRLQPARRAGGGPQGRNVTVEALANSGVDRYDIPAFLRKQAD
jgi:cell division protein FtsZ